MCMSIRLRQRILLSTPHLLFIRKLSLPEDFSHQVVLLPVIKKEATVELWVLWNLTFSA